MELAHSDEHNEDNPPPDVWRPKVCPLVVLVLQLCGSRSSGFPDETFVSDSPIKEEDEGNGRSSTSGRSSSLESLKALEGEMTKRKLIAPGAVRSLPRKHHPATSAYRSACAGCVLHFLDIQLVGSKVCRFKGFPKEEPTDRPPRRCF